jgi:hypothetical protein
MGCQQHSRVALSGGSPGAAVNHIFSALPYCVNGDRYGGVYVEFFAGESEAESVPDNAQAAQSAPDFLRLGKV